MAILTMFSSYVMLSISLSLLVALTALYLSLITKVNQIVIATFEIDGEHLLSLLLNTSKPYNNSSSCSLLSIS